MEGNVKVSFHTDPNYLFKDSDLSLEIKPSREWLSVVDYNALKDKLEENPTSTTWIFSGAWGSSKDTICRALDKLKKMNGSSREIFDGPFRNASRVLSGYLQNASSNPLDIRFFQTSRDIRWNVDLLLKARL